MAIVAEITNQVSWADGNSGEQFRARIGPIQPVTMASRASEFAIKTSWASDLSEPRQNLVKIY
jgi:hypothetical protein